MQRCNLCGFPDTRPGLIFENGSCGACLNFAKRKDIDWAKRDRELALICHEYWKPSGYDCLIPVSGGKDSYFLVHTLVKEMGMHPLLCTVTDSFTHTQAGTHNLRNLIEKSKLNHWQYTINHDLFKRATRAAFEGTGEALKFVEYAIYTIPVMLAEYFKIPFVIYGENSAYEYGTTLINHPSANGAIELISEKMEDEKEWWISKGITRSEVDSISLQTPISLQVIFMSYFRPWSSVHNLEIARSYGFKDLDDTGEWKRQGTIEQFEQIDSIAYMVHLWMKFPKFGFQRVTDIATRRLREGRITREECDKAIAEHDPVLDPRALEDFCQTLGYSEDEFWSIVEKHRRPI